MQRTGLRPKAIGALCYQSLRLAKFASKSRPAADVTVRALHHNLGLNRCSNGVWRIGHLPNAPQMPDALGGYAFRQVNSFAGMDKM